MLKKLIFFILLVCCYSCNNKRTIRDDISLVYRNYLQPDSFNFDLDKYSRNLHCDSFDVFLPKKIPYVALQGKLLDFILLRYDVFTYEYHKSMDSYGTYYNYEYKPRILTKQNVYACGKIKLHEGVFGYVLLFKSKLPISGGMYFSELLLFNLRNKRLCSLVKLAEFMDRDDTNENRIRTYRTDIKFFTQLYYHRLTEKPKKNSLNYDSNGWIFSKSFTNLKTQLGTNFYNEKTLLYTMFYVDEIGLVRYVKDDGENLPVIFSNKLTWMPDTIRRYGM